jgi:hypothetical protein
LTASGTGTFGTVAIGTSATGYTGGTGSTGPFGYGYQLTVADSAGVASLTYTDGSAQTSAIPALDLTSFGTSKTWSRSSATLSFRSVCMSSSGQYQSGCVPNAGIYYSSDYGVTWTASSVASNAWFTICMSSSGQFQSCGPVPGGSADRIYISNDYGVTWNTSNSLPGQWGSISMSTCGQYQVACIQNGNLYRSIDYGVTWTSTTLTGITRTSMYTGKYQLCSGSGLLYYSSTYGAYWTQISSAPSIPSVIAISASGQYQSVVGESDGKIYYSNNYGTTWTLSNSISAAWISLCMSSSGKYQMACVFAGSIYYSVNYGVSWISTSLTNANWYLICMSSNGQYATACIQDSYIWRSVVPYQTLSTNTISLQNTVNPISTASGSLYITDGGFGSTSGTSTYYRLYGISPIPSPGPGYIGQDFYGTMNWYSVLSPIFSGSSAQVLSLVGTLSASTLTLGHTSGTCTSTIQTHNPAINTSNPLNFSSGAGYNFFTGGTTLIASLVYSSNIPTFTLGTSAVPSATSTIQTFNPTVPGTILNIRAGDSINCYIGNFASPILSISNGSGTSPTIAPVVINASYANGNGTFFWYYQGGTNWSVAAISPIILSLYAVGGICSSQGFFLPSDERIKKNIKPNDSGALEIIKSISIHSYDYIDFLNGGNSSTYNIISQNIKKVYPEAVSICRDYIPSHFKVAVSIVEQDENVCIKTSVKHEFITSDKLKFILETGKEIYCTVIDCISDTEFIVKKWEDFSNEQKVFIYGKEIDDFMRVDKPKLGLLALAGVKELHKIVNTQNQQIQEQQAEITDLKAQLALLKSDIDAIKKRL